MTRQEWPIMSVFMKAPTTRLGPSCEANLLGMGRDGQGPEKMASQCVSRLTWRALAHVCTYILLFAAAYFTQATVDQLGSIDDVRVVRDLVVPEGIFKSTRVTKARNKTDESRSGESSKSSSASTANLSRYAPFPAPTLPSQQDSSGQVLMYQPYPNHDASAVHQPPQVRDDIGVPPVQQYPTAGASNPNPAHSSGFRDPNQYHSQGYRSLLPSSHPRSATNHLHDLSGYGSGSQQIPVKFPATDLRHPSAALSQVRPEGERMPSSHSHSLSSIHASADGPSAPSHSNANVMGAYTSNAHTFPAIAPSEWTAGTAGTLGPPNSSIYYGDRAGDIPTSAAAQSTSSYPQLHNEIITDTSAHSYQPMQFLNPPQGDPTAGGSISRSPLPPLSMLQETYSISYDFSVSMVSSSGGASSSTTFNDPPSSASSVSSSSQKSRTSVSGSNKAGGPCRDLDLAPLNSLARLHPYRREPMDDRALRLLGPRST